MDLSSYIPLTDSQNKTFKQLKEIFISWNQKVNLISRKDEENFMINHVLHSLSISQFISFQPEAYIMDLGTGGGFPGLPLAIFFPETKFILVDSRQKKIVAVQDMIKQLSLKNIRTHWGRAEELNDQYDFIVSRAVAPMSDLIKWTKKSFKKESKHTIPNGIIALKGGDLSSELKGLRVTKRPIYKYFKHPFFETKKIVYYSPLKKTKGV